MSTRPRVVPAYERLANTIRAAIERGELKPGDRVGTPDQIAAWGYGRNTYREALRLLESERLIVALRGVKGGTFVTAPSAEDVRQDCRMALLKMADDVELASLVDTRIALESHACGRAATVRTDDDLERIAAALPSPAALDPGEAFSCSWRFHSAVLAAAHNPLLTNLAEPISTAIRTHYAHHPRSFHDQSFIWSDHEEIYRWLVDRDHARAQAAMRRHLTDIRALSTTAEPPE